VVSGKQKHTMQWTKNTLRKSEGATNSQAESIVSIGGHWHKSKKGESGESSLKKIGNSSNFMMITLKHRRPESRLE